MAAQAEITSPTWYLVVWNALIGAGVGFALPSSMDLAMSVMDSAESGTGSGVVQCLRPLGGPIGVAILGTVLVTAYRDRLELDGLSAAALEAVRSSPSLGGVVAQQARMPELLANVQSSFMAEMGYVFYALSGVALLTSLIAAARVPREPGEHLGSAAGAL